MPWNRVKKTRTRRFFDSLDTPSVASIVRYFHNRAEGRRSDNLRSENFDTSDHSAYPYIGPGKRGKIDPLIFHQTATLLPTVADYFDLSLPMDLGRFVNSVVSCAVSTRIAFHAPRTGNTKPQLLKAFQRLRVQYKKIEDIFREYPEIKHAFNDVSWMLMPGQFTKSFDGYKHIPDVQILIEIIVRHIEIDIDLEGEAGRFLRFDSEGAKPKLHCVDRAAYICRRFNGPKIITTPGSDFSFICALFFEIATGKQNESMQGSIISLLAGERPELYWYEAGVGEVHGVPEPDDIDEWAAKFETRRAKILSKVVAQFGNDPSVIVVLGKMLLQQIRIAEEMIEVAKGRRKFRSLDEPTKK